MKYLLFAMCLALASLYLDRKHWSGGAMGCIWFVVGMVVLFAGVPE